jgi:Transposase DDE domain group 1
LLVDDNSGIDFNLAKTHSSVFCCSAKCADAAFAKPDLYEALEKRGVQYAIRIPANENLEWDIAELLFRPPGRPSHKPLFRYKSFQYQAGSWTRQCQETRHPPPNSCYGEPLSSLYDARGTGEECCRSWRLRV